MNAPFQPLSERLATGASLGAAQGIVNGLSVDVEDWFQVGAFENVIARGEWDSIKTRVEDNVYRVIDLFAEADVSATFFTLGWVAKRHPNMIRRIADAGHELASHGYDHARVFTMDRPGFAEDIRKARTIIEDCSGVAVTGYRAPSFSIDSRTPWAFAELAEQGYAYSSSVAPVAHDHYGWPEAPRFAFKPLPWSPMIELPVTTAMLGGRRVAAGGGGFFRVLPYAFSRWAIRQVNRSEGRPAVFYFHPWEVDPDQPRVDHAPLRSRFRHYTGLGKMAGKLRELVHDFRWGRMDLVAHREAARAEDLDLPSPDAATADIAA
ncbi:XrtA system polysaccharide deacetylase [uncultured Erythrobacter sp.]|uniref:XrtA system polysaccharide deacetylase n=1 Tax=uncultured Erythrobacter sp. TaxID=263913 RepID=UPI0026593922|nr:XrtA system polysaccharide deacetylase [uncultured Erythrobacter sp.]